MVFIYSFNLRSITNDHYGHVLKWERRYVYISFRVFLYVIAICSQYAKILFVEWIRKGRFIIIRIYNNPKGQAYHQLIDYAIGQCPVFVLAKRAQMDNNTNCIKVFQRLEPFLIKEQSTDSLLRVLEIAYSYGGTVYFYKSCPEAAQVLKEEADGLLAWRQPNLPEDLCFLDDSGKDWLINIAHEEIMNLNIGEAEGRALSEQIEGLFLKGEFNEELDAFLNDAIRHKAEKLHLSNYDLEQIPDKVSQITSLKSLTIFEGRVNRLPEGLFELEHLEELTVYTADLQPLPKEIGRLHRLRKLTIGCCSYYRWDEDKPLPAKETGSFHELPDEIGQLTRLEHLSINATPLRKLPASIANLKQLSIVDLSNNLFESSPAEIIRLPRLKYFVFNNNPMNE